MKAYILNGESIQKIDLSQEKVDDSKKYFIIAAPAELEGISPDFNLTECRSDHCLEKKQHTGIQVFKDHYCIGLNVPGITEGKVQVRQINLYYGRNFLIYSADKEIHFISSIEKELQNNASSVFSGVQNELNKLLYMMFDSLVIKSLGVLAELEKNIEVQEERVLKLSKKHMVNDLVFLRRQVFKIRTYLNPLTYVGDMLLLNELELIDNSMLKYFNCISIKFSQLNNDANELYHSISNLREAYESEISNQMNEVVKTFTIVSSIFLPLTLISGVYGMNFENIPELKLKYGYFMILGLMVFITGGLILVFKKKKWL